MALQVVSAPQGQPSLSVQPLQNAPQAPLPVQSAPSAPQPAQLPVQSAPSAPQPASLPVQSAPSGQQQSVAVQVPKLITAIQTAVNQGSQPPAIVQAVLAANPDLASKYQPLLSSGQSPQQVLQSIIREVSGTGEPQQSPQQMGLVQSLLHSIAAPIVYSGARIGEAIAAPFNPAVGEQDMNVHVPVLGDYNIPAQNNTSFRQEVGHETQTASLGISNPALAGAVYGFGDANIKQKGILGTIADTSLSAAAGKVSDVALTGASHYIASLGDSGASLINSLIKPLAKEFSFGKNPGAGIADEGIVADSLKDLYTKTSAAIKGVGEKIGAHVSNPQFARNTSNYAPVLDVFDNAIQDAAKGGVENQGIVTRLTNAKDVLTKEFESVEGKIVPKQVDEASGAPIVKDLTNLNPVEGNALKQQIGSLRKWTGNQSEDDVFNKAIAKAYGVANQLVNHDAPGVNALNSHYGNLLSAQTAIERRVAQMERSGAASGVEKLGLFDAARRVLSHDYAGAAGEVAAAGANHLLGSPAVKTRAAATINRIGIPDVVSSALEENPVLKNALSTGAKGLGKGARYAASRLGAIGATKLQP